MYFQNIDFKYEFRDYQNRVLESLKDKMDDNKVHIVAAPGSGKTVLGLEIIKRLDQPCLILVPSISIREQWIIRFIDLFVKEENKSYWKTKISSDIDNPGIITCITYQALYSLFSSDNYQAVILNLKNNGYKSICLDECHHLKREWWKALENTISLLVNPTIISLTATPPYDSSSADWTRYKSLCGEIDCEVSTAEMVKKHCLCPYQDHVYLSIPTKDETAYLKEKINDLENNREKLLRGKTLYQLMANYNPLINPQNHALLFIEEPLFLKALISYIKYYGFESAIFFEKDKKKIDKIINSWNQEIVNLAKSDKIPKLKSELLESFLEVLIHKDRQCFDENLINAFEEECKAVKFLVNNKIEVFKMQEELEKYAANSLSRIDAVKDIVNQEAMSMTSKLKMVILTDYIGKEELNKIETQESFLKLSCTSIFEMLRRMEHLNKLDAYMKSYISYNEGLAQLKLGLICGSFIILPKKAIETISKTAHPLGNTDYFYLDIADNQRAHIVSEVTRLLSEGLINILVGTISLLGEGWDAPCVNTVVIASSISSFVESNQIRGRALRLDPDAPLKTANIWHIASLFPDCASDNYLASKEYKNLIKRFDSIIGISSDGKEIKSGIERIGNSLLTNQRIYFSEDAVFKYVNEVKSYSGNRDLIDKQWQELDIKNSSFCQIRDTIELSSHKAFEIRRKDESFNYSELKKLAKGLHKNMIFNKLISEESFVKYQINPANGKIRIYLDNCRPKAAKLFLKYFEQLTGEIIVPRYVLKKGFGPFKRYLAIPDYCKNMKMAQKFQSDLAFFSSQAIYTRNDEGIKLLFSLRIKSMKLDKNTIELVRYMIFDN